MLISLLLNAPTTEPFVATRAYESRDDTFFRAAMAPNGDLLAQLGHSKLRVRRGVSETLRLPLPNDYYNVLGAFGTDGFAMQAGVPRPGDDHDDSAACVLTRAGLRRVTPARYLISYAGAAGRFIAADDDANERERAILWDGAWSFLPDLGGDSQAQSVEADGTVVGKVARAGVSQPCVWDAAHRLHVLPLPPGFEKGVATARFGSVVVGAVGHPGEGLGDTETFGQGMVWRDGKVDPSFAPILREGRFACEFTYADGRAVYGTATDAKGVERTVELRGGRLRPFTVPFRGRRYFVGTFVKGANGKVLGMGHRDGPKGYLVSALLVLSPSK